MSHRLIQSYTSKEIFQADTFRVKIESLLLHSCLDAIRACPPTTRVTAIKAMGKLGAKADGTKNVSDIDSPPDALVL